MERIRSHVPRFERCERVRRREVAGEGEHALVEVRRRVEGLREGATERGEGKHRRSLRVRASSSWRCAINPACPIEDRSENKQGKSRVE